MNSSKPTVVLVHGALTGPDIWHRVIAELQRRSFTVLAPVMPLRSLASDVACLRSFLESVEGPVVVAGHSYGGSIISDPAALTAAVRSLVFVTAFQQDHDEAAGELNYRFPGSRLTAENTMTRRYPGGTDMYLRPEKFAEVYAADLDNATAAVLAAAQHPIDPAALGEKLSGPATWRSLPSWTLIGTADVSIPTELQRFMAERAGSTVVEVASTHAVPLVHVEETADVIVSAAS
jgi:pimeloyl-ACP methyl ester carboxylesterase